MEFPVQLIAPDGREWAAMTSEEYTNLVFGHGYSVKSQEPEQKPKKQQQQRPAAQPPTSSTATEASSGGNQQQNPNQQ